MGRHTLEGNPPIEVILRKTNVAKRLSLRISRLDGRVTLTMPKRATLRDGVTFLRDRESWLRGHLNDLSPVNEVAVGGSVLLYGQPVPIVGADIRHGRLTADQITVPNTGATGPRVKALLRGAARDALAAASDNYAAQVDRSYTKLSLRDTRSRWGSCSSKGVLMYSWRLIMAPPAVLQYVAAHEVAHLVEMNHSAAFWSVVEGLCPDYAIHRNWLRDHGDQLHRVHFGD